MQNRLIHETSPYLLQHANNPVDWHPWGEEAFGIARDRNVPILLSVGYSACHWCHVMERESFENDEIAALMNELYVCIKVDREERPDVDSIYMSAVQQMTGQGGWPMTVMLTPAGEPFYGGTYFPPVDRGGMPGFPRVLQAMSDVYRDNRNEAQKVATQLVERIRQIVTPAEDEEELNLGLLDAAAIAVNDQVDDVHGGVGAAPKFPQPMIWEFMLRRHARNGSASVMGAIELALDGMARGGIYDQVGGGFHRYSTDQTWLVPHFEKMLYDNALLVKLYLHAYQVTGKREHHRIVEETLDYVRREMTSPEGGFYSAQDADSEGVEGKYFVWSPEEIVDVLDEDRARLVNRLYGVTAEGNFEGKTILHEAMPRDALADELGLSRERLDADVADSKRKLLEARRQRVAPLRDDKVLTEWNGLMLRAFAEAGAVLSSPEYVDIARTNASFLLGSMRENGRLMRTYKNGVAKLLGYLADYASLIDGLIALHEADLDPRWLTEAVALTGEMLALFWDDASGQFYDTGTDHEQLVVRPRDAVDNALPSGVSMATDVMLRLAVVTGNREYETKAVASLRSASYLMSYHPTAVGHWLCVLDFHLSRPKEIAIIGRQEADDTRKLAETVFGVYLPNRVLVSADPDVAERLESPLTSDRPMVDNKAAAYVCENYICHLPVTDPNRLARQLVG
ncbi:MAG: thioredoxin domain-containing protein [SAR202 cluster bacterium]|nr:thioredoxin domain-containing protein [SAR202 cluster bacterium]